jgi:hypothetical protein
MVALVIAFEGGKNSPFLLLKNKVLSNMFKYLGQLDSNSLFSEMLKFSENN